MLIFSNVNGCWAPAQNAAGPTVQHKYIYEKQSEEELLSMRGLNQEELTEDGTKSSSHRCHGNHYLQSSKNAAGKRTHI